MARGKGKALFHASGEKTLYGEGGGNSMGASIFGWREERERERKEPLPKKGSFKRMKGPNCPGF